jgi:hypothetical protein
MKKKLLICLCVLSPFFLVAQPKVIISELLYQPPYPNEGQHPHMHNGEFISIYNYGNIPVDVSGWRLVSDGGASQFFTFPAESIMQPGAKFYVAYRGSQTPNFILSDLYDGFQLGANDRKWYHRAIILNNTGESLRLYREDGTTQDSLWHSSAPMLARNPVVGTPGNDCLSLQRINVSVANGIISFNHSDWTSSKVALAQYPHPDRGLIVNGEPIVNVVSTFEYDLSGNRVGRKTIVLSSSQSMAQQSAPNRASSAKGNAEDENEDLLDKFYTGKLNESDVVIFPNPTKGALAVEIRNKNPEIPHQITVFNINGSIVFQKNNIGKFTEIDLSARPSGVYLLRISSQNSFITWRVIKE